MPTLKKIADRFAGHEGVRLLAIQTVFEGFSTNTQDRVRETQLEYALPITMGTTTTNMTTLKVL